MAEKSNEVMRCMLFYYSHFQSFYNSIRFFINDSQPEISSDVEKSKPFQDVSRELLPEIEESTKPFQDVSRPLLPEIEESTKPLPDVSGPLLPKMEKSKPFPKVSSPLLPKME